MKLQQPPRSYTQGFETSRNGSIERAFAQCHMRERDVEIGNGRLILTDGTTGTRFELFIDNGILGARQEGVVDATITIVARLT